MPERLSPQTEQELFNNNLRMLFEFLKNENIMYSPVGGLVLKTIMGENLSARRTNGTIVDFDAVAFGPTQEAIDTTIEKVKAFRKEHLIFPVSLEPVTIGQKVETRGLMKKISEMIGMLSSMRVVPEKEEAYLTYGDIEVEVPWETLQLKDRQINGIPYQSWSDKTIYHRYFVRGGDVQPKPKDENKLIALRKKIETSKSNELPDSYYVNYQEFVRAVSSKYKIKIQLYRMFWQLDKATDGLFSGSSGFMHTLSSRFISNK